MESYMDEKNLWKRWEASKEIIIILIINYMANNSQFFFSLNTFLFFIVVLSLDLKETFIFKREMIFYVFLFFSLC